jgi:hypothetical protein
MCRGQIEAILKHLHVQGGCEQVDPQIRKDLLEGLAQRATCDSSIIGQARPGLQALAAVVDHIALWTPEVATKTKTDLTSSRSKVRELASREALKHMGKVTQKYRAPRTQLFGSAGRPRPSFQQSGQQSRLHYGSSAAHPTTFSS